MHVLLVGWYRPLVKALKQGLEEEGFTVDVAEGGYEGTSRVPAADYDVVILDLKHPRNVSPSLVQRWHWAGLNRHVLVLAPPGSTDDQVPGPGPDGWLSKPFELEALLARLRAMAGSREAGETHAGVLCAADPWG